MTDLIFEEYFQPAFVSQTNMKLYIKKIISCVTVPLKRNSVAFHRTKSNMELMQFVKIFYSLEFVHSSGQEFTLAGSKINFLYVAPAEDIYIYIYFNYCTFKQQRITVSYTRCSIWRSVLMSLLNNLFKKDIQL